MRRLPPALLDHSPAEKLLWRHIYDNPGEHSARSLAEDLGGSWRTWSTALRALIEAGVVTEDVAPIGPKLGRYTATREAVQRDG